MEKIRTFVGPRDPFATRGKFQAFAGKFIGGSKIIRDWKDRATGYEWFFASLAIEAKAF